MAEQRYRWLIFKKNDQVSLVPNDPNVRALSNRLGWKTETLIARTEKALPKKIEQNIFLNITIDTRVPVRPETFRDIYLYFTNGQWLATKDLDDRERGLNIYANKAEDIINKITLTLSLLHWEKEEGYPIAWLTAAHLVQAYGEQAEEVLSTIAEYLEEIMDACNMKIPRKKAFAVIAKEVADISANSSETDFAMNITCIDDIIAIISPTFIYHQSNTDEEEE